MIARVAVNPDGLAELTGNGLAPADALARHRQFCAAIRAHGILVVANSREQVAFGQAVKSVGAANQEAGLVWAQLFKFVMTHRRALMLKPESPIPLAAVCNLAELRNGWQGRADLAAATVEQAAMLGVGDNDMSVHDQKSGIDVAPINRATQAAPLLRLQELSDDSVLVKGDSRELFFDEFVAPITKNSAEVAVYDRFLFAKLSKREHDGIASNAPDPPEQVAWLLNEIGAVGAPAHVDVTLIGSWNPDEHPSGGAPESAEDAARLVGKYWQPKVDTAIKSLEVIAARFYAALPHTRHLRSNLGVGITMEPGFDRFAKPVVTDSAGVEWTYRFTAKAMDKFVREEGQVRKAKGVTPIRVYG